jgi:E3 ubiquitin-protein ligase MARCH6
MEWLSHSQKKYCELCKTPFRFTKLYDPDMPAELPAPVFIKELTVHCFRTLITWLRFVLVAFVWLGWLPWSMRAIWRALFWLADGRWPNSDSAQRSNSLSPDAWNSHGLGNGTTPVQQTLSSSHPAVSTAAQAVASALPQVLSPVSSIFNFSAGDPVVLAVAKRVFLSLFLPTVSTPGASNTSQAHTPAIPRQRQPSWLSNVTFLNSLTSSPTLNNIVIDTLEGQLITLLVVISFILIFLIREWVVQQQPAVNLAEEEREAVVQLVAENQHRVNRAPEHPDRLPEDALPPPHRHPTDLPSGLESDADIPPESAESLGENGPFSPALAAADSRPILPVRSRSGQSSSRPTLHSRNALDDASNIHRTIEETASGTTNQTWPGLETFKDLWTRGDGDPEQILRIIQEDGRQEELGWVVSAMTRLQQASTTSNVFRNHDDLDSQHVRLGEDEISRESDAVSALPDALSANTSLFTPELGRSLETPKVQFQNFSDINIDFGAFNVVNRNPEYEGESSGSRATPSPIPDQPDTVIDNLDAPRIDSSSENVPVVPDDQSRSNRPIRSEESALAVPKSLTDRIFDWLWGDIAPREILEEQDRDDEHVVENPALEAPFVPVANRDNDAEGERVNNVWRDPAAPQVIDGEANDIDAVEEADDFEGILELIGMQGPIFGLLQNGVFSALLISFTVAVGIWLPYLWGKIALVFLTNPIQLFVGVPLALLSITADVAVDTLIGSVGYVLYWVSIVSKFLLRPVSGFLPLIDWIPKSSSFTHTSLSLIDGSSQRLKRVLDGIFNFQESDLPMFSVLSHQALRIHEARVAGFFHLLFSSVKFALHDLPVKIISQGIRHTILVAASQFEAVGLLTKLRSLVQSLDRSTIISFSNGEWLNGEVTVSVPGRGPPDYELARWDTKDRIIAIILGYIFASFLGILYLRVTGLITGVNRGQRIEGVVADVLHQAGGVMKVILIIGIEMIIFPLYCGLLLDLALMPLFENATLASRVQFTTSSPLTSLFVHWFVGTCYMFHFALFVSMCRKIMRTGVLCEYF